MDFVPILPPNQNHSVFLNQRRNNLSGYEICLFLLVDLRIYHRICPWDFLVAHHKVMIDISPALEPFSFYYEDVQVSFDTFSQNYAYWRGLILCIMNFIGTV